MAAETPDRNELDTTLETRIREEIRSEGNITFARFMDRALYEKDFGYYEQDYPVGTHGSFYTSVHTSKAFGRTIASACNRAMDELSLPPMIAEMGAGMGLLALDILDWFKEHAPETYAAMTYTIIERSERLISEQKKRLAEHDAKINHLPWERFNDFSGIFFSNELIDAFAVHRLLKQGDAVQELFVVEHDGKLTFKPDAPSTTELVDYIRDFNIRMVDGQVIDVNLAARSWVAELAAKLEKALVLTIDYGFEAPMLYAPHRMDGTVTCYFKHTQNNDFFERIGHQDITAFVDFTALINDGDAAGLKPVALNPQWLFLLQAGIIHEVQAAESDLAKSAVKALIMPEGGFGTNFQALVQAKGLSVPDDFFLKEAPRQTLAKLAEIHKDAMPE